MTLRSLRELERSNPLHAANTALEVGYQFKAYNRFRLPRTL